MKTKKLTTLLFAASSAFGLALVSCEVEKTQDGELPDVTTEGEVKLPEYEVTKTEDGNLPDVNVEGETRLPEYNVEGPDVEVGSREVEVPTIDIETPEEQRQEEATGTEE